MKHIFEIGTDLLCFEPDETKEKLIYQARVISHNGHETKGKIKIPLYLVHFLGWSKKWDRVVSESLLLPLSNFNKKLKDKIDSIAKYEKRNQLRHDLIDEVLEVASKVTNEDKFDWNELENKLQTISNKFKLEKKTESTSKDFSMKAESENEKEESICKSTIADSDNIFVENVHLQKENDFVHVTFSPKITLTIAQLDLLSLDKTINSKLTYPELTSVEDITNQSWNPCVLDILQNYIDLFPVPECQIPNWKDFERFYDMDQDGFLDRIENFPSSILDLSFDFNEKPTSRKQFKLPQWPDSELNTDYLRSDLSSQLCFEVCSGLRVLFDFYSRHILLYENEIIHYEAIEDIIALESQNKKKTNIKLIANETQLKLFPEEYKHHRNGFQPCLFFGFPHLLRLLYKLPTILLRLNLTRCSLAIVLRHCYSLIKFLDITCTGQSVIYYHQPNITIINSDKSVQHKPKRKGSPNFDHIIKHEPRILLRRLVLNSDQLCTTQSPEPRITRSALRLKNKN